MSFKRFDLEDIAISAESVVSPAWSNQATQLTSMYRGLQATANTGKYYNNMYAAGTIDNGTGDVQFSAAFGHRFGSGSLAFSPTERGKSPSAVIYGQYRNLVFGDENTNFQFASSSVDPSSYFITVNRSRFKEKLLPGSFELTLRSGSRIITLIDDSQVSSTVSYVDAGRSYNLVTGSLANGVNTIESTAFSKTGYAGAIYPDIGVIALNYARLNDNTYGIGISENINNNVDGNNNLQITNAIISGSNFKLNSEETVTSDYVFVRIRNGEFNYSTNPSNITGSGELRHNIMVNSPQAYITTVGLYNDNNDLLAVAKLSKPLLKDFTKEALVRIKLDF
jgi:hypothetical protein